jgi:Peptidase M50B-like
MRFLVGTFLLVLLPGVTAAFALHVVFLAHVPSVLIPIGIGSFLGILLDHFVLRRVPVVDTFEHELTHAVVALMFFRRVTGFVVKRSGGTVSHQGGFGGQFGTDFIGLAPYILPLFTVFSVIGRPFVPSTWFPWYDGWIGVTFGYHIWSTIEEIRGSWTKRSFVSTGTGEVTQTDIARRGYIYSAIFIAAFTLALHGLLIALLLKGVHGVGGWAWEVWSVTGIVIVQIGSWLKGLVTWVSERMSG